MNEEHVIIAHGEPLPQKRHRHTSAGTFIRTYDPSAKDKSKLLASVRNQLPRKPKLAALCVEILFHFSRPKSHFGTGRNSDKLKASAPLFVVKRPDVDNCAKFVLDALNGHAWHDDSQIIQLVLLKKYASRPSTKITIREIS